MSGTQQILLTGQSAAVYTTTAKDYDGSTNYATRGGNLTGISDGKQGIFSAWIRLDGSNGTGMFLFAFDTVLGGFSIERTSANKVRFDGRNAAHSFILDIETAATFTSGSTWINILSSWDLGNNLKHLYITDVSDLVVTTFTNDTLIYSSAAFVGCDVENGSKFNGCMSEIFFHTSYLDLSVTANRRLFISSTGKPVSPGSNGSIPLGVQPLVYIPNGDASANLGTGGNYTNNAALSACSSSPSD